MDELKGWVELPLAPEEFMDLSALGAGPDRLLIRADAFARILVAWQEKKQEKKLLAKLAEVINAKDSEWDPWHADSPYCPRCGSGQRHLHPAVQHEGEVQICPHPWHRAGAQTDPEPTPVSVWHPPRGSASWRAYNALSHWVEAHTTGQKLVPGRYSVLSCAPWIQAVAPEAEASDLLVREDGALVLRSGLPAIVPNGYGMRADRLGRNRDSTQG